MNVDSRSVLLCFLFFLGACHFPDYNRIAQNSRIRVRTAKKPSSNWAGLTPVNFVATLSNGEEVSVNHRIIFKDSFVKFYNKTTQLHLNFNPNHYKEDSFKVVYRFELHEYWDSIFFKPSYDAPIFLDFNGKGGSTKRFAKRTFLDILMQGRHGRRGLDGEDGQNGGKVKVYIEKDTVYQVYNIYALNLETKETRYYISAIPVRLLVEAKGGDGGHGMDGESGRIGSSGGRDRAGGPGGNGGMGGDGGNGGDGGQIEIYIHLNAKDFVDYIETSVSPGKKGLGGKGGRGGPGGVGMIRGVQGIDGVNGLDGFSGFDGVPVSIKVDSFTFNDILND